MPAQQYTMTSAPRENLVAAPATWNADSQLTINLPYLLNVNALITQYLIFCYRRETERAFDSLSLLSALLHPKMNNDDIDVELDKIEATFTQAYFYGRDGALKMFNPKLVRDMNRRMRLVFKELLDRMERRQILTYVPKDVRTVMGDFSKS